MTTKTRKKKQPAGPIRYVAVKAGSYPGCDEETLERLRSGEEVSWEEREMVEFAVGDVIDLDSVHPIVRQSLLDNELVADEAEIAEAEAETDATDKEGAPADDESEESEEG